MLSLIQLTKFVHVMVKKCNLKRFTDPDNCKFLFVTSTQPVILRFIRTRHHTRIYGSVTSSVEYLKQSYS